MAESTQLIVSRDDEEEESETEKVKFFMFLRMEAAMLYLVRRARAPNQRIGGDYEYCLTTIGWCYSHSIIISGYSYVL